MNSISDWPRKVGTWQDFTGKVVACEVYDDPFEPGYAAIYLRYENQSLCPGRTVSPEPFDHFQSVLTAWALKAPLVDYRAKPDPRLPTTR